MQQHWAMARQVGYYVVAMQQDPKKGKIKTPQDLFLLGFEEDNREPIKYAKIKKING